MSNFDRISILVELDAMPVHDAKGLERYGRLDENDEAELAAYREGLEEEHADELETLRLDGADEELLALREAELAQQADEALEVRRRKLMAAHFSGAELAGATHLYLALTYDETKTLLGWDGMAKEDFRPTAFPIDPRATPSEGLTRAESDLDDRLLVSLNPQGRAVNPVAFTDLGCCATVTFAGQAAEVMHGIALKKLVSPPVETVLRGKADDRWFRTVDGAGLMYLDKTKLEAVRLLHTKGEELRAYFRELLDSSQGERDRLSVLENGFSADFGTVFGTDDLRSRLLAVVEPDDVMPLLTFEDPAARDEGLRLLAGDSS